MPEFMVEAVDIVKRFGRHLVLDTVSISVRKGEYVGLIGNNGSGKSVLLKCLCGLLLPNSGSILIHGDKLGRDGGGLRACIHKRLSNV